MRRALGKPSERAGDPEGYLVVSKLGHQASEELVEGGSLPAPSNSSNKPVENPERRESLHDANAPTHWCRVASISIFLDHLWQRFACDLISCDDIDTTDGRHFDHRLFAPAQTRVERPQCSLRM